MHESHAISCSIGLHSQHQRRAGHLPHEEVLRYMVCKIRDNRSEEWLAEMCRKNNLSDVCHEYLHQGVLKALEGEPDVSFTHQD